MAATLRHRKLLQSFLNATTVFSRCSIQCDPLLNFTGVCSDDCILFCPSVCHPPESSPSPSPATSPHLFPPPPNHHHPPPPLSLPLKISLVFLFITVLYTLYKFFTIWHRSRPRRSPENQEPVVDDVIEVVDHPIWYIRTTGLQQSVINGLPVVKFSKSDGTVVDGAVNGCSVCLTEFEDGDMMRLLPNCKHAFHVLCIDTWLRSHTNCPLCRAVIVDNSNVDSQSERNDNGLGFMEEANLGVLSDRDRGEASGSSGLRIGGTDEKM